MAKFGLDGREYKLLLDGAALPTERSLEAGETFFATQIAPAIDTLLARADGTSRLDHRFSEVRRRIIRFWDLSDGFLASHGYSLRERLEADAAGMPTGVEELTLKLRLSDLFVVWGTPLSGIARKPKGKFEEDIAPLALDPADRKKPARARLVSSHSRFSRSLSQEIAVPLTWGGMLATIPELAANLAASGATLPAESRRLVAGPTIEETSWRGARLALGKGDAAEFTLTHWALDERARFRSIGELSFAVELGGTAMPLGPALRAHRLFTGLQEALGELLEQRFTSKTAVALPVPTGAP